MSQVSTWGGSSFLEDVVGSGGAYQIGANVHGVSPARITRPNNVTAYAAMRVYGDAADARISFVVPALPGEGLGLTFSQLAMTLVQGTPSASGSASFVPLIFSAQPATIIGDGTTIASLSDADIAKIVPGSFGNSQAALWGFTGGQVVQECVSIGATVATGRRALTGIINLNATASIRFTPGATYWMYLLMLNAYVPTALETVDLFMSFTYTKKVAA